MTSSRGPHSVVIAPLLTAAMLVGTCTVSAQVTDSSDPRARAAAHYERGAELFERDAFARAEAEFRQAYEIMAGHPSQIVMLVNLARAIEAQPQREQDAIETYERALREADPSSADTTVQQARAQAQERLAELRARLAARQEREPTAPSGERSVSPVGPVVAAVGAAAILAGVVTGAMALADGNSIASMCGDPSACPSHLRPQYETVRTLAALTDGLLITGAVVAALGIILIFTLHEGGEPSSVQAACDTTGCRATVQGRF